MAEARADIDVFDSMLSDLDEFSLELGDLIEDASPPIRWRNGLKNLTGNWMS